MLYGYYVFINVVCFGDDGEGFFFIIGGDDGIVRVYRWFFFSI